jgi:threonylcarbamoyladenosine tRNA methylthiotransferase MtaB
MNRRYTSGQYMDFLRELRKHFDAPGITTDVITGFPGETEDEHRTTLDFVRACAFSRLHVFPFSPRKGTKAYNMMPRVEKSVTRRRAAELVSLGEELETAYIAGLLGRSEEVLFEEPSAAFPGCMEGYSRRYVRVAAKAEHNEVKPVALLRAKDNVIFGEEN